MNAEHLLREWGDRPVHEVPYSVLSPILQHMSPIVRLRDIAALMTDIQAPINLALHIKGRGVPLLPTEVSMADLIDWDNFISVGMVQKVWGLGTFTTHHSILDRAFPQIRGASKLNEQEDSRGVMGEIDPQHAWKVVYVAPYLWRDMLCHPEIQKRVKVWIDEHPASLEELGKWHTSDTRCIHGYYLVNFAPAPIKNRTTDVAKICTDVGSLPMSLPLFLQVQVSHLLIHGYFPIPSASRHLHCWTSDSEHRSSFIRRVGDGWTGRLEIRLYNKSGPGRLKTLGINVAIPCFD
jgi:hypothetical protein